MKFVIYKGNIPPASVAGGFKPSTVAYVSSLEVHVALGKFQTSFVGWRQSWLFLRVFFFAGSVRFLQRGSWVFWRLHEVDPTVVVVVSLALTMTRRA